MATGIVLATVPASAAPPYQLTGTWASGTPDTVATGDTVTGVWRVNVNDDGKAPSTDLVDEVTFTLTLGNGTFTKVPSACLTDGVDPASSISKDGTTLVCNLGTQIENTAVTIEAPVTVAADADGQITATGTIGEQSTDLDPIAIQTTQTSEDADAEQPAEDQVTPQPPAETAAPQQDPSATPSEDSEPTPDASQSSSPAVEPTESAAPTDDADAGEPSTAPTITQPTDADEPTQDTTGTAQKPSTDQKPSTKATTGDDTARAGADDATVSPMSANPSGTLIRGANTFYAYVDAGENLDIAFIKAEGTFTPDATMTVHGPGGFTDSCTVPGTDPLGAACSWMDLTATTAGIWQVDFEPTSSPADSFSWTVNVQSGTTSIPGRVYSQSYGMFNPTFAEQPDVTFWYKSQQGFLYRAAYTDFNGVDSGFASDAVGVAHLNTCVSAYESGDFIATSPYDDSDRLWRPMGDSPGLCGDRYKIFFETPDSALPVTATMWDGSATWLNPPVTLPDLSNLAFTPDGPPTQSGEFTFDVTNFAGQLAVQIDANNDGDYTDPQDRTVPAAAAQDGTVTVPFDGMDGQGNPISSTQPINARVAITQAGEIHFLNNDVETRAGLEVEALNGPDAGATTLYWNDTQLRQDRIGTIPPVDGRAGVDSAGGVHGWVCQEIACNANTGEGGSWGDTRTIDDWTYHAIDEFEEIQIPGVPPEPWVCTSNAPGILFQQFPTDSLEVDLVTGGFEEAFSEIEDSEINGIGYNVLDDYIYGWSNTNRVWNDGDFPTGLVRIGSDYTVQYLGLPDGWNEPDYINTGDIDDEGHYWAAGINIGNLWREIDLEPGSPTFGEVLDSGAIVQPAGLTMHADWSFNPVDGRLYGMAHDAAGTLHLVSFDRTTHVVSDDGSLGLPAGDAPVFGATFMDADGFLYASQNVSGDIYRVDTANATATLFAQGPVTELNDGARCPSPIYIDLGDAPDSYGTLLASDGPRHGIPGYDEDAGTAPLMLGGSIDPETDGVPTPGADGDDAADAADENGVADPITMTDGQPTTVTISATNDTNQDATLAGWIDLNGNGTFDPGERQTIMVPANSGTADYELTYAAGTVTTVTYSRFRLFPGGVDPADILPTGPASAGEVEDYRILIERFVTPEVCEANQDIQYPAFTFSDPVDATGDGGSGSTARYENVALMNGEPIDMFVEVVAGSLNPPQQPPNGFGTFGDDAGWNIVEDATIRYTFYEAGTTNLVPVNAVFNVGDMDYDAVRDVNEVATFNEADLSGYGVTQGSAVQVTTGGGNVAFTGTTAGNFDPTQTFQFTLEGISSFETRWQGNPGSGFGLDGDGDLSIEPDCQQLDIDKDSDASENTRVGDTVTYTVTVTNTGMADYTEDMPASIKDDLTGVLDDGTYNDDATASAGTVSYAEPKLSWSGPLAAGDSVTITYTVTLDQAGDLNVDNTAYQTDCDATDPDCDPPTPEECVDGVDPATGLACDPEEFDLPHLTLDKASPDITDARVGDTINYTITATNDGEADYTDARPAGFIDDMSGVLDDATYNNDEDASTGTVSFTDPKLRWTGALAVGESATISYSVLYTGEGDNQVDNMVFEPPCDPSQAQCDPPMPEQCVDGVDPATGLACDPIEEPKPNLEIDKSSPDISSARVGDTVTYTVTATNTGPGDYTDQNPGVFIDDLAGVLDDATYNDDASAPAGTVSYEEPLISWAGALASGNSVTLTYTVTLIDGGDRHVDNVVFGSPCDPTDPTCEPPPTPECPPEGKDPTTHMWVDCIKEPLPELEIDKSSPDLATAQIGDTVDYTVTLTNVGPGDFTPDRLGRAIDDLSGVLDDAMYNNDADASTGNLSYSQPRLTWTGPLAAGKSVTITYSVTLTGKGDLEVDNIAFEPPCDPTQQNCDPPPPEDCVDGVDPDTGLACDPEDGELPKLKIDKTSPDLGTARVGDTVHYTVKLTNVGKGDYTADRLGRAIDDLSGVLDDATYNNDANASAGSLSYSQPRLTWTGPMAAGKSVTITYSVTLTGNGDMQVDNVAFEPPCDPTKKDCDPPPPEKCENGIDPTTGLACDPENGELPKLKIDKTSPSLASAEIGDTVDYTVTLTNVGKGDFTADRLGRAIDDLSGVLDDATYNNDANASAGSLSYTQPRLVWTGELKAGASVTLTYSVALTGNGDMVVDNIAFEPPCDPTRSDCDPIPPEQCENGVNPATGLACDDVIRKFTSLPPSDGGGGGTTPPPYYPPAPVPDEPPSTGGGGLAWTGMPVWLLVSTAGILLVAGAGTTVLTTVARRRRRLTP